MRAAGPELFGKGQPLGCLCNRGLVEARRVMVGGGPGHARVTVPQQLQTVRSLLRAAAVETGWAAELPPLGAMIETPAAAMRVRNGSSMLIAASATPNTPHTSACTKLHIGPASATHRLPQRGLRRLPNATGTGFA